MLKAVNLAVLLLAAGAFAWYLLSHWADIVSILRRSHPLWLLSSAALLTAFVIAQNLLGAIQLRTLGARAPLSKTLPVVLLSLLGKYLPGKVWVVTMRLSALDRQGIPARTVVAASALEHFFAVATGVLLVPAFLREGWTPSVALALSLLLGAVFILFPDLVRSFANRGLALLGRPPLDAWVTRRQALAFTAGYLLTWLLLGAGIFTLGRGLFPDLPGSAFLPVTGSYAFSVIAGFLAVFAPGGLGVREGIFALALAPYLPPVEALFLALAARILTSLTELMAIGAALVPGWLSRGGDGEGAGTEDLLYQENYSSLQPDWAFNLSKRRQKAAKIRAVLEDRFPKGLSGLTALDVGCSTGAAVFLLAERCRLAVGIDIDRTALSFAREHAPSGAVFIEGDSLILPFPDGTFDLAVCSHVYEHVPDPARTMREIHRVLRPGGVCFFAAANLLQLVEPHHRLPLLSLLPRPLANAFVRIAGKGDRYYERLLPLFSLRRLVRGFRVIDYTGRILSDPEKFCATELIHPGSTRQRIFQEILGTLYWACPTYIWVLEKPRPAEGERPRL